MSKDDYSYDGAVVFQTPIKIRNDQDDVISIYGLVYNREQKHKDDLWIWGLNRYICYLQGCEKVQKKGCILAPGTIMTADNNMYTLNNSFKNIIYRIMKKYMTDYRLIECEEPFVYVQDEIEDVCIISQGLIDRIQKNDTTI